VGHGTGRRGKEVALAKIAAGLLLFRRHGAEPQVLLVHPGGPLWARRDLGVWSIPKGEPDAGEDLLVAARREFQEETGAEADGAPFPLGQITQKGGKVVHAWALEGNAFSMEWPPRSGRLGTFPEVDRAEWFDLPEARRRIKEAQVPLVDALERWLTGT